MSRTRTRSAPLNDTQLLILSAAAQRDDRGAARPESMGTTRFVRAIGQLLARGLLEAVAPGEGKPGRSGERLRITASGLEAIGLEPDPKSTVAASARPARSRKRRAPLPAESATTELAASCPAPVIAAQTKDLGPSRPGTKRALIVSLLSRPDGASVAQLIAATGWLPHTTRAALTGLRRSGYAIERAKEGDGTTVYRIVGAGSDAAAVKAA